jgi:uncharacterized protein (DUF488 family)
MPAARIWTIGHSTRSIDDFLSLLRANQVTRLADIRTIPKSGRHPHFSSEALDISLKNAGIEYRHFPDLGGLRKPRPDSPNSAWKNASFRGYADYMRTPAFSAAVDELLSFGDEPARAAVMCAEAVWWRCHRRIITDYLLAAGERVMHILGASHVDEANLTAGAVVRGDRTVVYPAEGPP